MNLAPGQRLTTGDRTVYEIVGGGNVTARHAFPRARKRFWNYRDRDKTLYEADEDEALGVLLRVPRAVADLGPGEGAGGIDFERMRRDLDFELERVLDRFGSPWLPEPLDVVDWPAATPAGAAGVPLLVLADPHAEPLAAVAATRPLPALLRLGRELLRLLDRLHGDGLVTGGLDEDSLWLDGSGSWTLMSTAGIRESTDAAEIRADLAQWAGICRPILARCRPDELEGSAREDYPWLGGRVQRVGAGASSAADLLSERASAGPLASFRAAVDRLARRRAGPGRRRPDPPVA
jgi:hypothetical protein